MRYEALNTVASSALNAFRMLQQVVDDKELQKLHQQSQNAFNSGSGAHPNLGGCVDSPEAATVVLMLVGALGIYFGSRLFLRHSRKSAQIPNNA